MSMSKSIHHLVVVSLGCLLSGGWSGAHAQFVLPPGVECPDPEAPTVDFNCHFVFEEQADKKLNEVYNKLLIRLGKPEAARLRVSQRAWLAFRDADVALVVAHYGEGGSLGRSIAAQRSAQLTRTRIKDLDKRLTSNDAW
jgi:uncharacterized protein YecT (DUF1311 family)